MQNYIVVDIHAHEDDGDLGERLRRLGCEFEFIYAPVTARRESELSRWLKILPQYIRAALKSLAGKGRGDHLVFLAASGISILASAINTVLPGKGPKISAINFIYRKRSGLPGKLIETLFRFSLKRFAYVGVPSKAAAQAYRNYFPLAKERIHYFPTWCGFPEKKAAQGSNRINIFAGGRSVRDYATLLKALQTLQLPALLITNKSSVNGTLVPENVKIQYDVDEEQFADMMLQAECVVVPLRPVQFDAGQSVVLQAMCYGKPVIATDAGCLSEYIKSGETGLLVPPGDASALTAAIRKLQDDKALAQCLAENGYREYWQKYSRDVFAQRLIDTFCEK